jgi:hypothetical protein
MRRSRRTVFTRSTCRILPPIYRRRVRELFLARMEVSDCVIISRMSDDEGRGGAPPHGSHPMARRSNLASAAAARRPRTVAGPLRTTRFRTVVAVLRPAGPRAAACTGGPQPAAPHGAPARNQDRRMACRLHPARQATPSRRDHRRSAASPAFGRSARSRRSRRRASPRRAPSGAVVGGDRPATHPPDLDGAAADRPRLRRDGGAVAQRAFRLRIEPNEMSTPSAARWPPRGRRSPTKPRRSGRRVHRGRHARRGLNATAQFGQTGDGLVSTVVSG